ncbi:hypothetical protein B0H34DRAFT_475304 [Crassisporium funariophilum]|nr:hypothetical protein B0H34DRAFT_475304 [Crassisporium funariophilum]
MPRRSSSQEFHEGVFRLSRPVELDHHNHITSTFSILDTNESGFLDVRSARTKRSRQKSLEKELYESNMSCFPAHGDMSLPFGSSCQSESSSSSSLGHLAALQSEDTSLLRPGILVDSSVPNFYQGGSSVRPVCSSTGITAPAEAASTIYSHHLLHPIQISKSRATKNRRWPYCPDMGDRRPSRHDFA